MILAIQVVLILVALEEDHLRHLVRDDLTLCGQRPGVLLKIAEVPNICSKCALVFAAHRN